MNSYQILKYYIMDGDTAAWHTVPEREICVHVQYCETWDSKMWNAKRFDRA